MSSPNTTQEPLVRLQGLPASVLPSPTASPEELAPFVTRIMQGAIPFIDSAAPKSGSPTTQWKHKGDKSSPDSAAKVEVWERVVSLPGGGGKETWMCRRSVHADAAEKGTASWAEFERSFRYEHAEVEDAFTPNVIATHAAVEWAAAAAGCPEVEIEGDVWGGFALKVEEMRHKVGRPVLKDRTFPVLQAVAATPGSKQEFVVVSIPVPDFGSRAESKLASEKGAQVARYVSVERIRKLPESAGADAGKIEWLMATASDAGGVLPMWVQNMAMPGVVWKDVPLFLSWIAKDRVKKGTTGGAGETVVPEEAAVPAAADL